VAVHETGKARDDCQELARFDWFRDVHLIGCSQCFHAIVDSRKAVKAIAGILPPVGRSSTRIRRTSSYPSTEAGGAERAYGRHPNRLG
jgi:hypothetical protein